MAKKPTRKQRKVIRAKQQRAHAHGLPAPTLERPSKPAPADWDAQYSRRASGSDEDDELESQPGSAPAAQSLLDWLKGLPVAVKLVALVVAVVIAIGLVVALCRH